MLLAKGLIGSVASKYLSLSKKNVAVISLMNL
jgi:hypothetical protein